MDISALVVHITDNEENPNSIKLNTRAYIFTALTRNETTQLHLREAWLTRQAWTITNLQQLKSIYATLEIQSNDKHVQTSEVKLGDIHILTSQTGLAKLGAQLLLAIHGKNLLLQTTQAEQGDEEL